MTTTKLDWQSFGRCVLVVRTAANLGIRGAAKEIGISSATLSRVENGKKCGTEVFLALCSWVNRAPYSFVVSQ